MLSKVEVVRYSQATLQRLIRFQLDAIRDVTETFRDAADYIGNAAAVKKIFTVLCIIFSH
jgi:hypothetical protein